MQVFISQPPVLGVVLIMKTDLYWLVVSGAWAVTQTYRVIWLPANCWKERNLLRLANLSEEIKFLSTSRNKVATNSSWSGGFYLQVNLEGVDAADKLPSN